MSVKFVAQLKFCVQRSGKKKFPVVAEVSEGADPFLNERIGIAREPIHASEPESAFFCLYIDHFPFFFSTPFLYSRSFQFWAHTNLNDIFQAQFRLRKR